MPTLRDLETGGTTSDSRTRTEAARYLAALIAEVRRLAGLCRCESAVVVLARAQAAAVVLASSQDDPGRAN